MANCLSAIISNESQPWSSNILDSVMNEKILPFPLCEFYGKNEKQNKKKYLLRCLFLQLVESEKVRVVLSLNEKYELKFFTPSEEV